MPIVSTRRAPISGKACFSSDCIQARAVRAARHRGRFASKVATAAARKVGVFALRFPASGSMPSAMATRLAMARWRALARETAG